MPAVVHQRRRTRYDTPAWAEHFPDTAEGLDALASHDEARRLPRHTDPDTLDDEAVRQAFLEQLDDERAAGSAQDSPAAGGATVAPGTAPVAKDRPPARLRSALRADAGGAFGAVDIDDAAGLLLGLVAYAVTVSAFRDPKSATNGVRRWFAAKFFNKTSATGTLTASAADPGALGLSLVTAAVNTTDATPVQPPAPSNIGDILRSGLPASALTAPRPAPIPGAGG